MSYLAIYTNNLNNNTFETEPKEISNDEVMQDQMRFRFLKLNTENAIKILSGFPTISAIDFSHNQINTIPDSPCALSLLALDLSYNTIEFPVISIQNYHNLIELNISNNKISDLTGLTTSGLRSIEYLNLSFNFINQVSGLENMVSLKVLKLQHNNITTFSSLRLLSYNSLLRDIFLEGNIITADKYFKIKLLNSIPSLKNIDDAPIRKRISLQSKVVNDGLRYSDLCTTTTSASSNSNTGITTPSATNATVTSASQATNLSTTNTTMQQYIHPHGKDITHNTHMHQKQQQHYLMYDTDSGYDDPLQLATMMIMNASARTTLAATTIATKENNNNNSAIMNQSYTTKDISKVPRSTHTGGISGYSTTTTSKYSNNIDIMENTDLHLLPWRKPPNIAPKSLKNIDKNHRNEHKDSTTNKSFVISNNSMNKKNHTSKSTKSHSSEPAVQVGLKSKKSPPKHKTEDESYTKESLMILKYELPSPWMTPTLNNTSIVVDHNMSLILPQSSSSRNVSPAIIRKPTGGYFNSAVMPTIYSYSNNNINRVMDLELHSPHSQYYQNHSYLNASIINPRTCPATKAANRYINNNNNNQSRSISPLVSPTRSSLRRQEYIHNNVDEKQNIERNELQLINQRTFPRANRQSSRSISPRTTVSPTKATLKRHEFISNKIYEIKNVENNELKLINNRTFRSSTSNSSVSPKPGSATNKKSSRSNSPYAKQRPQNQIRPSISLNTSDSLLNMKEFHQNHRQNYDLNKSPTVVTIERNESPDKGFVTLRERISSKYAPPSHNIPSLSSSEKSEQQQSLGYLESKRSNHNYDVAHNINSDHGDVIFKGNIMEQKYFDESQVIESKVDLLQDRDLPSDLIIMNINNSNCTTNTSFDQSSGYSLLYTMIQQRKSILENIAPPPPPSSLLLSYAEQPQPHQPSVSTSNTNIITTTTSPSMIISKQPPAIATNISNSSISNLMRSPNTLAAKIPAITSTPSKITTHVMVHKKLNSPSPLKKAATNAAVASQDSAVIFDNAINKLKTRQAASFQALHHMNNITSTINTKTNNNTSSNNNNNNNNNRNIPTQQTKEIISLSPNISNSNSNAIETISNINSTINNNTTSTIVSNSSDNNSRYIESTTVISKDPPKTLDNNNTSNSFFKRFSENNPYMKELSLSTNN